MKTIITVAAAFGLLVAAPAQAQQKPLKIGFIADLAYKTRQLVEQNAGQLAVAVGLALRSFEKL